MENMDVLVRGVVMQNPGLGLGLISFAGLEWAWVAVVATIVVAFVSVKRVSIVSVGLTWRGKPGQVRVRVQSFSSSSDGNCIVTASGMFSAELVKSSEAEAESSLESCCSSEVASKVAAEMVFIFKKKTTTTSVVLPPPKMSSAALRTEKVKSSRRKLRLQPKTHTVVYSDPQPTDGNSSVSRREGIDWDPGTPTTANSLTLPTLDTDFFFPTWPQQSLPRPLAYTTPSPSVKNASSCEWDPLLKLKVRDAVVCGNRGCFSIADQSSPIAPLVVASRLDEIVTLKNDVVRLWDSNAQSVKARVRLPEGYDPATAFDVNWDLNSAAVGRADGSLSLLNLDHAMYAKNYSSQQRVVQAVQFDKQSAQAVLTGGRAAGNAGCLVSLWDTRTSRSELHAELRSASAIYGLRSHGHELLVRDEPNSLSAHDMRMLGCASHVRRAPCAARGPALEAKWWDMDTGFDRDEDDDGEFWDCPAEEAKAGAGGSFVGSFVLAVSRSFSSRSLGR